MNQIKYILSGILAFPLLPIMYWQGKRIRASVPKLPEAKEPEGKIENNHQTNLKVITIGESTIAGVGAPTHEEGFSGTLAKALSEQLKVNVNWQVFAKSGYTADHVTKNILPKLDGFKADLIVIGLGGNDAFCLNSPNKWHRSIVKLITSIRSHYPTVPLVFSNMPPIKLFPAFTPLIKLTVGNLVEVLGDVLSKSVRAFPNVYYYDKIISFEDWNDRFGIAYEPEKYFSDGVHPSLITYQIWARDVADFITGDKALKEMLLAK